MPIKFEFANNKASCFDFERPCVTAALRGWSSPILEPIRRELAGLALQDHYPEDIVMVRPEISSIGLSPTRKQTELSGRTTVRNLT
jgi:hypothetical protein